MSSTGSERPPVEPVTGRLPGPDVVRALALAGVVVMNYHGYLIIRGGERGGSGLADLFDPWTGPFSTRFAATFVLVAGVGVTLLVSSSRGDPDRMRALQWRLASRGLALYAFGVAFDFIWHGAILPFYGAMFALAAVLVTLRSRWVLAVGASAAAAGWAIRWWRVDRELAGHSTEWLTDPGPRSPRGLLFDVAVNGTHPLLPWLAFFCAGIVLGRVLLDERLLRRWRPASIGSGLVLFAGALIAHDALAGPGASEHSLVIWSTNPIDRGILYTASTLGTSLVAFACVSWLAERFVVAPPIDALRRAGQLSLTVYVLHAVVFNLLVDWLEWVEPAGVGRALVFALAVWVVGSAAAVLWQRRFGRGPLEHVYRSITA